MVYWTYFLRHKQFFVNAKYLCDFQPQTTKIYYYDRNNVTYILNVHDAILNLTFWLIFLKQSKKNNAHFPFWILSTPLAILLSWRLVCETNSYTIWSASQPAQLLFYLGICWCQVWHLFLVLCVHPRRREVSSIVLMMCFSEGSGMNSGITQATQCSFCPPACSKQNLVKSLARTGWIPKFPVKAWKTDAGSSLVCFSLDMEMSVYGWLMQISSPLTHHSTKCQRVLNGQTHR